MFTFKPLPGRSESLSDLHFRADEFGRYLDDFDATTALKKEGLGFNEELPYLVDTWRDDLACYLKQSRRPHPTIIRTYNALIKSIESGDLGKLKINCKAIHDATNSVLPGLEMDEVIDFCKTHHPKATRFALALQRLLYNQQATVMIDKLKKIKYLAIPLLVGAASYLNFSEDSASKQEAAA